MADETHSDPGLTKNRRISFTGLTAEDVRNVAGILSGQEHAGAVPNGGGNGVSAAYRIARHKFDRVLATYPNTPKTKSQRKPPPPSEDLRTPF